MAKAKSKSKKESPPDHAASVGGTKGRPVINTKQTNIRIPPDLLEDLQFIGQARSMDLSNVVRMILGEHIGEHLQEAHRIRQAREESRSRNTGGK